MVISEIVFKEYSHFPLKCLFINVKFMRQNDKFSHFFLNMYLFHFAPPLTEVETAGPFIETLGLLTCTRLSPYPLSPTLGSQTRVWSPVGPAEPGASECSFHPFEHKRWTGRGERRRVSLPSTHPLPACSGFD